MLLFLPLVRAVHVLLKPGLEIPELMLHSVHHLHGCIQVSTTQTVVYYSPNRMAFYLTVLLGTKRLTWAVRKPYATISFYFVHLFAVTGLKNIYYSQYQEIIIIFLVFYLHAR